ncbi:MAG: 5-formyltetrahydrofolate cyclo-ligase [Bacteroidota bacterium]
MKKKDIRNHFKQKRAALTNEMRNRYDQQIHDHFLQLKLPYIQCIHHYLPVADQHEVKVQQIIDALRNINPELTQIVPVMKDDDMIHVHFQDHMKTQKNRWGIDEPIEQIIADIYTIDCVLVPLLAFDLKGNRVGYGKGCYDRFLASNSKEVIKIGLSYFGPLTEITDTDKFDIPLNYCITPERIYEFG